MARPVALTRGEQTGFDLASGNHQERIGLRTALQRPRLDSVRPTLIAISHTLAMLKYKSFVGSTSRTWPCHSSRIAVSMPEQRMRIEQEFHSMYSFMSSSGASKSGAM
jgi:hypothetical protein